VAFRIVDGEARLERTGDHLGAGVEFHLFSASHQAARKLTTHEHLESLRDRLGDASDAASAAARISRAAQTCLESWNSGQALEFGRSAGVFARIHDEHGLEHASARRDRLAIEALPGVLGVKGCGAGLADALWVLSEAGAGAEVQSLAVELGLRPVAGFRP
ncbi:MAG TPA: hypothetical protein VL588_13045, partial [Bdellovibrionota bacterium]|nr:hypothetical protein [Bdellovibrionota bacterium]